MLQLLLAGAVGRNDEEIIEARPLLVDKEVTVEEEAAATADTGSCWL